MTPCVPAGMVVFWPLGIWIASQSRLNVNSVFSYMALTFPSYYATDEKNDEARMSNDEGMTNPKQRATILFRHSSFGFRHSVHIPLVALLAFQLLDVFVGLIDALAALLLDNLAQGCVHVLGHAACVTAHEKLRALGVDPFPDLGRVFRHLVLDVDFLGLITRPRAI